MGKTINTILNLTDKFTPKLTKAREEALVFKQKLKNCNAAAVDIDKGLSKLAKTAVATGAAGVAAMSAFAVSSLNTYKDFQQSMSNVSGILSISQTSEEYKKLEAAAREAGKTTTKTAKESADALSYMALAGWSTQDSVSGLMPVLRASEATGSDLATTSDLITDSMSALGLQTNELQHYLDICARAQNKSNTSLVQMQQAYIAVGGTFKAFDTPLEESGTLLGILANRGIKGSEAGTRLQSTLVNLTKQSGQSAKAMAAIGVSAYDSQGKFRGVTNVLRDVQAATANLTEEERNNYLTMIAGKTQLTTLNALMAGLTATNSDGQKEYEALYNSLNKCGGALNAMANTMTNNLSGAMARAQSATDDLKITIGKKLEPYVTQFFNWFSEKLPSATEKFGAWLDSKLPKAINFAKSAFEKIKPVFAFVIKNFGELASAGVGVIVGLKSFSILTKVNSLWQRVSKTARAYTGVAKLAKVAQVAFNTSLLACPLTWVAVGIGAVVGGILLWKKHLEKADIAKHFGDITLSAEECQNIVKGVFGSDFISKIDEASSAQEQFKSSLEATSDSAQKLNKLNFQIEYGGDVSKEDYLAAVDEYTANLQQAINDRHYSLSLNAELLFSGSEFGTQFMADASGTFGALYEQASGIGEKLRTAVEEAYKNGWDFDSTQAVSEYLKEQAEIQEKISTAQSEAKLETLKLDFASGDLSKESFENLVNATNEELEKLKETYQNARVDAIAAAKLMYTDGSAELQKAIDEANAAYNEKIGGLMAKGLSFENEAIMGAFPEIGDSMKEAANKALGELYSEDAFNDLASGAIPLTENIANSLVQAMDNAFQNVPDETRKHIGEFYEAMTPSVEELNKAMKGMEKVPEAYANVFAQSSAIGAVGKNAKALNAFGVTTLSTILPEAQTKILAGTKTYGDYYAKGIASDENKSKTKNAADSLRKILENTLTKPISVTPSITYGTNETPEETTTSVDSNATGTTYFGGGFTRINENGGEIINLPTGSQVIPADKSEKALRKEQSINVSVNVNGSIFGLENAAEVLGNMICGRVVEAVKSI